MGAESYLIWGLALLALSVVLIVAELFIPSGGMLGVGAGLCAIAGVVFLFAHDALWGAVGLAGVLVLGPLAVSFAFKVWPHTPLGRRIIGAPTEEELARRHQEEVRQRQAEQALVGREGLALTDLRPVGAVEIDGKRHEVLSETLYVPAGSRIRVTHMVGGQIKVRQIH